MVQIAKPEAAKTTYTAPDGVAKLDDGGSNAAIDFARDATDKIEDTARDSLQALQQTADTLTEVQQGVARRSAEGTAALGHALVDLAREQTRHNLETWRALTKAIDWREGAKVVDWGRVVDIQSDLMRSTLERATQLMQRYVEAAQALVTSAASATRPQAEKKA